jgi:hypothetical protein
MFKCKCGGTEFSAHQILRVDIVVDGDNEFIRNENELDDSLAIYDAEAPYGPYVCRNCGMEYDNMEDREDSELVVDERPYIKETNHHIKYKYNPKYGDNKLCVCGHPYCRHFDPYESMEAVGCKYCDCYKFIERTEENKDCINICRICGKETNDKYKQVCDTCAKYY